MRARDLHTICDSGLTTNPGRVIESDRYFTAEALIASVESGPAARPRVAHDSIDCWGLLLP